MFGEIGYWKDALLIWKIINGLEMDENEKFEKYDELIRAFRHSLVTQRHKDLKKVSEFISPHKLGSITCDELEKILKVKASDGETLDVSYVGKFCVREKNNMNNELYWFNKDKEGKLVKEPMYHIF